MKATAARAVLMVGVFYCGVGIILGLFAGRAAAHQAVVAWRWAAWVISAIAFGAHIVYAQLRLGASPRISALQAACAAGLGAFGLAVAANVHGFRVAPYRPSPLLVLSLAIWPVMTAVAAFVAALIAALLFSQVWRRV